MGRAARWLTVCAALLVWAAGAPPAKLKDLDDEEKPVVPASGKLQSDDK